MVIAHLTDEPSKHLNTVNPLYSKVPRAGQKLYYKEIFTIESAQYSVKSEPGDFEQLYYMEIFTIGRFTIERVNCMYFQTEIAAMAALIGMTLCLFACRT